MEMSVSEPRFVEVRPGVMIEDDRASTSVQKITEHTIAQEESPKEEASTFVSSLEELASPKWDHISYWERTQIKSKIKMRKLREERDAKRHREIIERLGEPRCGICGAEGSGRISKAGKPSPLHIDHDHATGEIRGFLCHHCNLGIGNLKDDVALLRAAIVYLEWHAANPSGVPYGKSGIKPTPRGSEPFDPHADLAPLHLEGFPVPLTDRLQEVERIALPEVKPRVHVCFDRPHSLLPSVRP